MTLFNYTAHTLYFSDILIGAAVGTDTIEGEFMAMDVEAWG